MTSDEKRNIYDKRSRELFDLLNDVDELDWLEAKSLRDDTSRSILETVCSFSNEPGLGGGVILIGVAESKNADGPKYIVDGVDNPDKAQLDLATQCKSVFNTPIYPAIKVEKLRRGNAPAQRETTTPPPVTTTPPPVTTTPNSRSQGLTSQPQGLTSQPQGLTSQPQGLTSQPQGLTSQPLSADMPIHLIERITNFPRRARNEAALLSIIVDVCSWKAQTNESLAQMLNRSPEYIRKFLTKHIGKELDYLYPMMVHHPRQAYVASGKRREAGRKGTV